MIDICSTDHEYIDYMNLTKLDRSKQAQMQEATMESVYWFHEG